jgi:hypothetical protein
MLEAAFQDQQLNMTGVAVAYWMDDNILPSTTFPNLAYSIRGKPAEAIVQRWFQ